jgi:polyisoprenoid-binding protein YceI
MSQVAVQPFIGTYRAQPAPSTFAFAVRHSGTFWFRGALPEVAATLRADGDALALEGSARVDSITVVEPEAMRASVLGPQFFDAERHPEVSFRSTEIRLADDGQAAVEGELTMKGRARPVFAIGEYSAPRQASSARSPDSSSGPRSTAASSASTGRWSCPTAASRSAGRCGSTSTCC